MSLSNFSIIIPVYNGEAFIGKCLDSIIGQFYKSFEIICIDDGSTDNTQSIIKDYSSNYDFIKYHYQENSGPGAARNKGIDLATGNYVLFVDSDDWVHEKLLLKCHEVIDAHAPDMVNYDIVTEKEDFWEYKVFNKKIYGKKYLLGEDCFLYIHNSNSFTTNCAYKKEFLDDNNIRFLNTYIYEDNDFFIKCCLKSKSIYFVHYPLYFYTHRDESLTKDTVSIDHYEQRIQSLKSCLDIYYETKGYEQYESLIMEKMYARFMNTYHKMYRAGAGDEDKKAFIDEYLSLMRKYKFKYKGNVKKGFGYLNKRKVFSFRRKHLFKKYVDEQTRIKVEKADTKANDPLMLFYKSQLSEELLSNSIFFIDNSNPRSLSSKLTLEKIINDYPDHQIYYVSENSFTEDTKAILVERNSEQYYSLLARCASVISLDYTVDENLKKRAEQKWTQIWHGTDIKRKFFDSNKTYYPKKKFKEVTRKYTDIKRWDEVMVDDESQISALQEAWDIPVEKIKSGQTPKTEYLIKNKSNLDLINNTKEKIDSSKKIVLYCPTWRDHNYRKKKDYNYLLDLNELNMKLGDDFIIWFYEHPHLESGLYIDDDHIITDRSIAIEDALLAADIVVGDYSSLINDAVMLDKKVYLFANDIDKYEEARGLYPSFYDLESKTTDDLEKLVKMITS